MDEKYLTRSPDLIVLNRFFILTIPFIAFCLIEIILIVYVSIILGTKNYKAIFNYIKNREKITIKELSNNFNISNRRLKSILGVVLFRYPTSKLYYFDEKQGALLLKKKVILNQNNARKEELRELKDLYEEGLITRLEYESKKKQILGL